MKKLFIIVMMFLLPYQYAWALVASYDVHGADQHNEQVDESHFGNHEHQSNVMNTKANTDKAHPISNSQNNSHDHYGFFHLTCGEMLNSDLPVFEVTGDQFLSQYSLVYHDPTSNVLDRPKWSYLI